MKKVFFYFLLAITFVFMVAGITLCSLSRPLPQGKAGEKAEALTAKIESAINKDAWDRTAAVSFVFTKRGNRHFRDKRRDLVEVIWGEDPVYRVIYSNKQRDRYLAWADGKPLKGEEAARAMQTAYKHHTNDYFWLNPYSMLRAPGTVRKFVGEEALLLTFQSGGVTPGDSYLIITDQNGLPQRRQMWVQIIPIKGIEWRCTGWTTTETGARINLKNEGTLLNIGLSEVVSYPEYPTAKEKDRFSKLLPLLE